MRFVRTKQPTTARLNSRYDAAEAFAVVADKTNGGRWDARLTPRAATSYIAGGPGGSALADTDGGAGAGYIGPTFKRAQIGAHSWMVVFSIKDPSVSAPSWLAGEVDSLSNYIEDLSVNSANESGSAGSLECTIRNTGNSTALRGYTGDIGVNDGRVHCVVWTFESSTAFGCYVDSVKRALTYPNVGPLSALSGTMEYPLWFNQRNLRGSPQYGCRTSQRLYAYARLPYLLSDPEDVSANPWQLFEPEQRKVFLPPVVTSTTKKWHATPIVRTAQPRNPTEIDLSNPFGRRLLGVVTPQGLLNGPGTWMNPAGGRLGIATSGGANNYCKPARTFNTLDGRAQGAAASNRDFSVVIVGNVRSGGAYSWVYDAQSDGMSSLRIRRVSATGYIDCQLSSVGSGHFTNVTWPEDANVTIISLGRYNAVAPRVWFDGVGFDGDVASQDSWDKSPPFSAVFGSSAYPSSNPFAGTGYLFYALRGLLTDAEAQCITLNPWQIFKPDSRLTFVDHLVLQVEPRWGRPISDYSNGAWNASTGVDRYAMIDEETADDNDYIYVGTQSTIKFKLTALGDPGSTNHVLKVRMASPGSVKASIYQGASTLIAAFTQACTNTPTDYSFDLSVGQRDSITDYTDLYLWLESL